MLFRSLLPTLVHYFQDTRRELARNLGIRPGLPGGPEDEENRGNVGRLVAFPRFQFDTPLLGEAEYAPHPFIHPLIQYCSKVL